MRAAVIQINSIPYDVDANLAKVSRMIKSAAQMGAELVVVPETFTTGLITNKNILPQIAETIPGKVTDTIASLTKEYKLYFYGSIVEKDKQQYYNTGILIDHQGNISGIYRKIHLFDIEKQLFSPGNRPVIVETELGRLGLTICMDLLFPEYIRGLVVKGAEYILNTTNWLRRGIDRWGWSHLQTRALAIVRALENTVGLVMACQWGQEGEYTKFGYSCIVSPSGRVLAGVEEGEGIAVHDLTLEGVEEWRKIATYLEDRLDHINLYRELLGF